MAVLRRIWIAGSLFLAFAGLTIFSLRIWASNAEMRNLSPGCPPNGYNNKDGQPELDGDVDGDGKKDSWRCKFKIVGPHGEKYEKEDEKDNSLGIVAIAGDPPGSGADHYSLRFLKAGDPRKKSVEIGRCVYPCGRNTFRICFEDKNNNGVPDRFTKAVWESRDGGGVWEFKGQVTTFTTDLTAEKIVPNKTVRSERLFGAYEYEIVDATIVSFGTDLSSVVLDGEPIGFPNGEEGMRQEGETGSWFAHKLAVTTPDPCVGEPVQALGRIKNKDSVSHDYEVAFFAVNGTMNHGKRTLTVGPGEIGIYLAGATPAVSGDGAIVAFAYSDTGDDKDGLTVAEIFSARSCGDGGR